MRSAVEQRRPVQRLGEALEDEAARLVDGARRGPLAERVVIEARQDVALLDRRAQPLEEAVLRAVMHHPVGARDQQLRRDRDGARVGHHALGGLVEAEQDVDGDRPRDQRIGVVATRCARGRASGTSP